MARDVTDAKGLPGALSTYGDQARTGDDAHHVRDTGVGTLERIWLKRAKRGPWDPVDSAILDVDRGHRGNANLGGRRQLTIISDQRWSEMMEALGLPLPPAARRANLMV